MSDVEKVINGLECCKHGDCVNCPYDELKTNESHKLICNAQLTEDILSLIKEQPQIEELTMSESTTNTEKNNSYQEGYSDAMWSIVHCKDCYRWKRAYETYGCCSSLVISNTQFVKDIFFCGDGKHTKDGKTNWDKWKEWEESMKQID